MRAAIRNILCDQLTSVKYFGCGINVLLGIFKLSGLRTCLRRDILLTSTLKFASVFVSIDHERALPVKSAPRADLRMNSYDASTSTLWALGG
jgi:hypothetical protein